MKRIAEFKIVSKNIFFDAMKVFLPNVDAEKAYNRIKIPARATSGSAGYDFFCPCDIDFPFEKPVTIPTGIRAEISEGWVLKLYPRSSLGFKHRLSLDNTVGIIDSDYFYSDNEGHILIRMTNYSSASLPFRLEAASAFAQGVFVEYGITFDDKTVSERNGGFGSTDKNS